MKCRVAVTSALMFAAGCAAPGSDLPVYRPRALHEGSDAAASEVPAGVLTLDDCVRIALERSRNVRIADRRVLIAQDQLWETIGHALPQLNVEGNFSVRNSEPGSTFGDVTFVTGKRYVGTAHASLLVPIYAFGRAENELDARKAAREIETLQAGRTREDTVLEVGRAYFRVLEAGKIDAVVEESTRLVERQLEIARDFLGQGLVASSDVLTADVSLASRRQDRLRAQRNLELAKATLNRVMGLDVDAKVEIADVAEAEPWQGTYEGVLGVAIANRKDLEAYRQRVGMAQSEWKAVRADLGPIVFGSLDFNYSTDATLLHKEWLSAGVTVRLPLFDGGTSWARIREREKLIYQAMDMADGLVDDIALEVKQAFLDLREAAEAIPLARGSISVAEENLRVIHDQYSEGLVSSADVLGEEDRLATARSRYYQAVYEYRVRLETLRNVAGGEVPALQGK